MRNNVSVTDGAVAALVAEDYDLSVQGIDEVALHRGAGRLSLIKGARVPVAPACHLRYQRFVPLVEGRELATPAARFRVMGVSPAVFAKNAPEPVEFAMLSEQVLAAEKRRRQVPDSHEKPFR